MFLGESFKGFQKYSSAAVYAVENHINYYTAQLSVIIYLKYYTMKQPTAIIINVL